ncbi:unnamed protein product [Peniophora sp. CBMAI 1063]|nr:unnamed protein product [Peniophora sp. CBMAI 1063]
MGKETRHPSTPLKEPYPSPPGGTLSPPPATPSAPQQQYRHPSHPQPYTGDLPSPAHSSGTSHSSRSSPPRASGSTPGGQSTQGSATTGSPGSTGVLDPRLFTLLEHGLVAHTFGSKLANAFFREVFAKSIERRTFVTEPHPDATAEYRHIDRAFTRRQVTWKLDEYALDIAVVDYALDERCGRVIRYNSAGADWKPPRNFSKEANKPGLHWFQSRVGGAGIALGLCENSELAYHYLRVPQGQRVKCVLSNYRSCNLRIKWRGYPDKTFEIPAANMRFGREMFLHELAAVVGNQVLRYFEHVATDVPGLEPVNDVIVLGLIHLDENEWTVMLQHCPPELRRKPLPGWPWQGPGAPEWAMPPPAWAAQMQQQAANADTASIASGSSGRSGLSATTTLAGPAQDGRKRMYAGSVAGSVGGASPGYAPSYSSASPHSQYSGERDDASTIAGKYNYSTQ